MRPRRLTGALAALAARFLRARDGSIILKAALAIPAVATLALGAVDLTAVQTTKAHLQDIADAAALAGANELGLAVEDSAPIERGKAWVATQLTEWSDAPETSVDVQVIQMPSGVRALQVKLTGHRESFFGNMLPPGGWTFHANATAASVGLTPLCVLAHGEFGRKAIEVKDTGRITAPGCMVHSNKEILVSGGGIAAEAVQSVDWARGRITPAPHTGAAQIKDPFTDLPLRPGRLCTNVEVVRYTEGLHYLSAGVHCGLIVVSGEAELKLRPGDHWFMVGGITLQDDATLTGTDVVLVFDTASKFDFRDRSMISLDGRKSGPFAGFVMAATRGNLQTFTISSDHVENLLGVIYVPQAELLVEGSADVARESAWTVIVARYLELKGSPSLFINADYEGSPVPVPDGVGPRQGGSRLVK